MCSVAQKEFTQYFPKPGWVEHDANEIWTTQLGVALSAMNEVGASAEDIAAIGITNQRETTIVWDRDTGEPVYHAIVWQCRRTSEYCDELKARGLTDLIRAKDRAGHRRLLLGHKAQVDLGQRARRACACRARRAAVRHGGDVAHLEADLRQGPRDRLLQRQPDDAVQHPHAGLGRRDTEEFSIYRAVCCRDPCPTASSTSTPTRCTSAARSRSRGRRATSRPRCSARPAFTRGEAKSTFGTGGFLLMNTGEKPVFSENGLVTTVAWGLDGRVNYALEGSIFVAGAAIQWLRDELQLHGGRPRQRVHGAEGQGHERLLRRACVHRSGCAALGPVRPRHHRGPDPRREQEPHHPRDAGQPVLPDQRCAGRHAGGFRH